MHFWIGYEKDPLRISHLTIAPESLKARKFIKYSTLLKCLASASAFFWNWKDAYKMVELKTEPADSQTANEMRCASEFVESTDIANKFNIKFTFHNFIFMRCNAHFRRHFFARLRVDSNFRSTFHASFEKIETGRDRYKAQRIKFVIHFFFSFLFGKRYIFWELEKARAHVTLRGKNSDKKRKQWNMIRLLMAGPM